MVAKVVTMIYEVERSRPAKKPDVEFILVRTTGVSPEAYAWLEKNFGSEKVEHPRWFMIVRTIFFRHEQDYIWFRLRWQ